MSSVPTPSETILAICSKVEDHDRLRSIFASSSWRLRHAGSCADAAAILSANPISVVICEDKLPDGTWRDVVAACMTLPAAPRMIVCSRAVNDELWKSALALGVSEVTPIPFQAKDVSRSVNLSWRHWRECAQAAAARAC